MSARSWIVVLVVVVVVVGLVEGSALDLLAVLGVVELLHGGGELPGDQGGSGPEKKLF